jgi:hypothetical protein
MKIGLRRVSLAAAVFVTTGLVWALSPAPAGAIGPTETEVACAVQPDAPAPNFRYRCAALVGDADPGADPDPTGTVVFFLDAISSSAFLGQCTVGAAATPGGVTGCGTIDVFIPPGQHTVWAVYYPAAGSPYSGSVASEDVGNPSVPPPDPTDTHALCVPTSAPGAAQPLQCVALVVDDDSDAGPPPTGTVAFFLNAISTSAFIGQCTLVFGVTSGFSLCEVRTTPVPPGSHTIWAVYYGDANYQGSVDSDPIVV